MFVIWSLAAAYTQYYCLISVAFLYIALLIHALLAKHDLRKVLVVYAVTIAGYLPWFFVMLHTMTSRVGSYWMQEIPSIASSLGYLFSYQFPIWLWAFVALIALAFILRESGVLRIDSSAFGPQSIRLDFSQIRCTNLMILTLAGGLCILGTIGFGMAISILIQPFYVVRYLYPASTIAWLLLGIMASRCQHRYIITAILMTCMLSIFIPGYQSRYRTEKAANESCEAALASTTEIQPGDVILTDSSMMNWTVAECYYPDVENVYITAKTLPTLRQGITYWFFITDRESAETVLDNITDQGYICQQIVNGANIGTDIVDIYKIVYEEQPEG